MGRVPSSVVQIWVLWEGYEAQALLCCGQSLSVPKRGGKPRAVPPHYLMHPPGCTRGLSQTPIISHPLGLSKTIWPLVTSRTKRLSAPPPLWGARVLSNFHPSRSVRAPGSLGRSQPQLADFFFAKGPGILISRAVNYLHGHPVPSWPPRSCPRLRPVW